MWFQFYRKKQIVGTWSDLSVLVRSGGIPFSSYLGTMFWAVRPVGCSLDSPCAQGTVYFRRHIMRCVGVNFFIWTPFPAFTRLTLKNHRPLWRTWQLAFCLHFRLCILWACSFPSSITEVLDNGLKESFSSLAAHWNHLESFKKIPLSSPSPTTQPRVSKGTAWATGVLTCGPGWEIRVCSCPFGCM